MPHCIVRIFEPLLRLLLPGPGRRRNAGKPDPVPAPDAPTSSAPPRNPRPVLLRHADEPPLLRPYVLTPAELRERRRPSGAGGRRSGWPCTGSTWGRAGFTEWR